jgi:hypothetical protein
MKWIPVPADAGASCDARERNAALVAIGACFVLAITVLLIAIFLVAEPVASLPTVAGSGTSGAGSGSGAGFGAGIGDGTGTSGSGPGAGQRGDGRGRTAPNGDPTPRGALVGAANETRPDAGESLVDGERTVVPEFGFTVSDETQPLTPNATTAGTPTGGDRVRAPAAAQARSSWASRPRPERSCICSTTRAACARRTAGSMR